MAKPSASSRARPTCTRLGGEQRCGRQRVARSPARSPRDGPGPPGRPPRRGRASSAPAAAAPGGRLEVGHELRFRERASTQGRRSVAHHKGLRSRRRRASARSGADAASIARPEATQHCEPVAYSSRGRWTSVESSRSCSSSGSAGVGCHLGPHLLEGGGVEASQGSRPRGGGPAAAARRGYGAPPGGRRRGTCRACR